MPAVPHPWLDHFLSTFSDERSWGQVQIRRQGTAFELRHLADRAAAAQTLREVPVPELRRLAERTATGEFRPLKTAPTLVAGWLSRAGGPAELQEALHHLYPGTLPDWWASVTGTARPTEFAAVIARQFGKKAQALRDLRGPGLAAAIQVGCGATSCLRLRRWSAPGVPDEDGQGKSVIPCLDPCPVFLSWAQACARMEGAPTVALRLAPEEVATVAEALRLALDHRPGDRRDRDLNAPLHPRRVERLLFRHAGTWVQAELNDLDDHANT